eukprot:350149-Chlamydomonas_euryale.AAC.23
MSSGQARYGGRQRHMLPREDHTCDACSYETALGWDKSSTGQHVSRQSLWGRAGGWKAGGRSCLVCTLHPLRLVPCVDMCCDLKDREFSHFCPTTRNSNGLSNIRLPPPPFALPCPPLDLGRLGVRLASLVHKRAAVRVDVLAHVVVLGQVEELADLGCTLGAAHARLLLVSEARKFLLALLHDLKVEYRQVGRDYAATD